MTSHSIIQRLQDFVFYYPFFMSYLWMIGGVGSGRLHPVIITHLLMSDNNASFEGSLAMISFVLLLFVYLTYQQFKMEPPLLYGPRECPKCHKIVYRKPCPYCEAGE